MAMPLAPDYHTAELVRAMPDDGNRYEVVWGELLTSPADISWSVDTLVQPDLFVIAPEHVGDDWPAAPRLRLVVEVLSPSTARRDRFQKRRLYQANGVETLWLVDPERHLVEAWSPAAMLPVVITDRLTWHPAGASAPLEIELGSILG